MTWVVTLTYDIDPSADEMDTWAEQLEHLDGSIARGPSIPYGEVDSTSVTVYIADEAAADNALAAARTNIAEVVGPAALLVAAEVTDEELHLRRADAPTLPRMVSSQEVAEMLHVSRQRVSQLRSHSNFPVPLLELRTGPIWSAAAIEKFGREWTRKPGRPTASAQASARRHLGLAIQAQSDGKAIDRMRERNRARGVG